LNTLLIGKNKTAAAKALVDSGATGNLINRKFAAKHQMMPHVLKKQDIILGTGWLIKHNPEIDWENYELKFLRCPSTCKLEEPLQLRSKPTTDSIKNWTIKTRRIKNTLPEELWSEANDSKKQMGGWTYSGLKAARVFFPETESLYACLSGLAQDITP
jgi:hypothetical protein